ncbi:hypothetical protein ABBQ32_001835 [Trebouxia sp. C0010 RCD-2024]
MPIRGCCRLNKIPSQSAPAQMNALQSMHAVAPAAAPAWEDESGLEDIDLDQLVSQHRSRLSPPVLPELPQAASLPAHHSSQQRMVRPAAAAAAAVLKSSALPTSKPPVLSQHQPVPAYTRSAYASSEAETPQYGSALPGDLQGVKERLLEVAELLLDGNVAGPQAATLQQERKQLQELRAKLEAEPQYGRAPPNASPGRASAFQTSAQRAPSAAAPAHMPHMHQPDHQQPQASSWQHGIGRQHLPLTNHRAAAPSHDNWDIAAASGLASNSWGQQGSGPHPQGGTGSFAYDAPDPAPREDMGMAEPDPSLRMGASGEPDGFVTCHQHDGLVDKRWDKTFKWSAEMQNVLERNFGTKTFRANQRQAINASLAGKDVFVLMPTGGGMLHLPEHPANLHP